MTSALKWKATELATQLRKGTDSSEQKLHAELPVELDLKRRV